MVKALESPSELAWNQAEFNTVLEAVKKNQPVLCYGPPGTGKSTTAQIIAKKLNLHLIETNGSDDRGKVSLGEILSRSQMRTFKPVLFFIDECDNLSAWLVLRDIVALTKHPLILACNDLYKIDDSIKNRCTVVRYLEPPLLQVVNQVRLIAQKEGIKEPQYQNVNADFRGSLLSSLYGGSKHQYEDIFGKVENLMKKGIIPPDIDDSYLLWMLDNSTSAFYGRSLYEFLQLLCEVDMLPNTLTVSKWQMVADFCALKARSSLRVTYPNYLKRVSVLRNAKRKNER